MQASQSLVGQAGMTHRLGARNLPATLRDGWPAEWPAEIHAYRLQDRLGPLARQVPPVRIHVLTAAFTTDCSSGTTF